MKNTNLSESVRILMFVTSVIIICILCATGFKLTKAGQSGVGSAAGRLSGMVSDYSDIDMSLYDGSVIKGSEVASLIKKAVGEGGSLAIEVLTLDGSTRAYNCRFDYGSLTITQEGAETEPPKDNSQYGYINAAANFLGASYRNANGSIVCLRFEQQK